MSDEIKPGDLYTRNGIDFCVQHVGNGQAYGIKYRSEDRGLENFSDVPHERLRLPLEELAGYGAERIRRT